VLLMLDVMLDLMLDRVHAMTHVALRASFDDDVANWFACARGKQNGAALVTRSSRPQAGGPLQRVR
jgi:hypothetical protein